MSHFRPARNIAVIAAFAYLLTSIALVAVAHPICRPQEARAAHSIAERYRGQHDDLAAARMYFATTASALGCGTKRASLLGTTSLAQAAAAYSRGQYRLQSGELTLEISRAMEIAATGRRIVEAANPYAQIYGPIVSAIARATTPTDP